MWGRWTSLEPGTSFTTNIAAYLQFGLGSTLYWNVGELERHVLVSHRLNQQWHLDVDWYVDTRNAHEPNIVLYLSSNLTIICVFFDFFTCWDLIHWWNLNVRNYWDHLKLIMTTYFYYADWVEIWRNLFGQELSSNSSSFCSSGTQNFHLLMYLYNYLFLTMKWNHKWGLGWKALSYITKSIFLLSTNPRYLLFQPRVVLWGHIFSIFDCTCVGGTQLTDLLADAICYQRRAFLKHLMFLFSLLISLVSVLCTLLIWRTRSVHLGTSLWSCPISEANVCVCVHRYNKRF